MINLGVIGLGGIARWLHIPQAVESGDFKIKAAADVYADNGTARELGIEDYYDDYKKLLADPRIEAVVVTSPHNFHVEHCTAAFSAGKHVLVEKPIARNLEEARVILEAADKAGTILMLGFNERYSCIHAHIKRLIEERKLGELLTVRIDHYQNFNPEAGSWWRNEEHVGGGCVIGSGIHRLDLLRWYLGEPVCVYAAAVKMEERLEAEACAHAAITFDSGVIAQFYCNWAAYSYLYYEGLSVSGKEGMLVTDSNVLRVGLGSMDGGILKEAAPPKCISMYEHFGYCIKTGETPLTSDTKGYKSLRFVRAIYKSIETGMPVRPKEITC